MLLDQNKTHLSESFFNKEEIKTLNKGEKIIRVEPVLKGGKCYLVQKGGYHFATMQLIIKW